MNSKEITPGTFSEEIECIMTLLKPFKFISSELPESNSFKIFFVKKKKEYIHSKQKICTSLNLTILGCFKDL